MKILITGGSGFLGINLVRYFLNMGLGDIRIIDLVDFDYPEKDKVAFVQGDIRDRNTVTRAMKGVSLVIHTAAALPLYKKEDIYSTDVEGTRNLLDEAYKNEVDRFIHISSTAVYGIPDHHPLREDDKLIGVGHYGKAKILAENICLEYREKGMCVPIIRPKSFIGPERLGVFALLYDWAKDGKGFPMMGSGNNRYQLLDVEDLCESIYLCAVKDREIVNDIFNIGAKEFTTMKDDWQAVLDEAGYVKKIVPLPAWPAMWTLRLLEFFRLSPLYKWVYETACKDSFVAINKAKEKLGFVPKYSNKEALLRNYRWYIENFNEFEHKRGVSHRLPWKQGILKLLKPFF
jgi:nucleoside-diphosphate-sugar epimerase